MTQAPDQQPTGRLDRPPMNSGRRPRRGLATLTRIGPAGRKIEPIRGGIVATGAISIGLVDPKATESRPVHRRARKGVRPVAPKAVTSTVLAGPKAAWVRPQAAASMVRVRPVHPLDQKAIGIAPVHRRDRTGIRRVAPKVATSTGRAGRKAAWDRRQAAASINRVRLVRLVDQKAIGIVLARRQDRTGVRRMAPKVATSTGRAGRKAAWDRRQECRDVTWVDRADPGARKTAPCRRSPRVDPKGCGPGPSYHRNLKRAR